MKKQLLLIIAFLITTAGNAQTWTQIDAPTVSTINDCSFINETTGWIITDNAIFNTTDGGTTWTNQFYPLPPFFSQRNFKSVHFINANVGIIACENIVSAGYDPQLASSILWTDNGGVDWIYKNLGATDFKDNDARLISPTIAYILGKAGKVKKTIDGGATWSNYDYPSNSISAGFKLAVVDESTVFFGGIQNGFIHYGTFGQTLDSGANWLISNAAPGAVAAIYFLNGSEGWIGGNAGLMKHTADAGTTWDITTTNIDGMITDISFADNLRGWATSDSGQIITTIDQGTNWHIDYQSNSSVNAICMIIPNDVGYAVGADGLLLKHAGNLNVAANTTLNGFRIYPNPASTIVNLEFDALPSNVTLVVYNLLGQIVIKTAVIKDSKIAINVQDIPNGIYYVQLSDSQKRHYSSKLVIDHR